MLLAKLKEFADERMQLPPPLYAMTPVAWVVELDPDGRPLTPTPTARIDPSTTRGKRGLDLLAPEAVRSVGIKPLLLADNGEYTFGRARDPAKQGRAIQAHEAYLALLRACQGATGEPAVEAVTKFYDAGGARQLELSEDWDYGLKITFRVHFPAGVVWPINTPAVQAFWAAANAPDGSPDRTMQCHVCGLRQPVLDRLQAKVKGIRGGQSSGTSVISANADAFESYGLMASQVAPTCANCGEHFTRALNELIGGAQTHLYVGDATFVFWTRSPGDTDYASVFTSPSEAQVRLLLDAPRIGRRAGLDEDAFYASALSASGGRAVVRDWIDTTVGEVRRQVARWFQMQEIVDPYGEPHRPLGVFALAASTVRDARELPVTTPRALLRAAITGSPLPAGLAFQAVRRNRAEQTVTRQRAALTKLVLASQGAFPEDSMVSLEEGRGTAYDCGRLLAVLEEVQRAALPGVSATIIDRFFGTASSSPAGVFGRLLRGAQPHLARLERDRRGAFFALQRRLEEVCGSIGSFPRVLNLEEQALFSLGYYHQRAHDRAEAARARAAGKTAIDPDTGETGNQED